MWLLREKLDFVVILDGLEGFLNFCLESSEVFRRDKLVVWGKVIELFFVFYSRMFYLKLGILSM